jgi:membrane protein YdbS with pleckstrin-like domain
LTDSPKRKPTRPTIYESGVDLWIAIMLIITPVSAAGLGLFLMFDGRHGDAMILFLTAAATLVVTAAFTIPCRYTILHDALSVRCGIICYQIPIDQVERIEPSKTILSGPALSMRRVLVTTSKRQYILSPRQRDEFIADLSAAVADHKRA